MSHLTDEHIHWIIFFGGLFTGALITAVTIHIALKGQYEKPKEKN